MNYLINLLIFIIIHIIIYKITNNIQKTYKIDLIITIVTSLLFFIFGTFIKQLIIYKTDVINLEKVGEYIKRKYYNYGIYYLLLSVLIYVIKSLSKK